MAGFGTTEADTESGNRAAVAAASKETWVQEILKVEGSLMLAFCFGAASKPPPSLFHHHGLLVTYYMALFFLFLSALVLLALRFAVTKEPSRASVAKVAMVATFIPLIIAVTVGAYTSASEKDS